MHVQSLLHVHMTALSCPAAEPEEVASFNQFNHGGCFFQSRTLRDLSLARSRLFACVRVCVCAVAWLVSRGGRPEAGSGRGMDARRPRFDGGRDSGLRRAMSFDVTSVQRRAGSIAEKSWGREWQCWTAYVVPHEHRWLPGTWRGDVGERCRGNAWM